MATRTPPRFVPTLTEVVRVPEVTSAGQGAEPDPAVPLAPAAPEGNISIDEDGLVRRVMQKIDHNLERRLREAVAATVIEQTRSLVPALREQIEALVRETVSEALADAANPDPHQRR